MGSATVVGVGVARKARLVFLRVATASSRISRWVVVLVEWCVHVCVEVIVDSFPVTTLFLLLLLL